MSIQHLEMGKQLISDPLNKLINLWLIINLFNQIKFKVQLANSIHKIIKINKKQYVKQILMKMKKTSHSIFKTMIRF